MKLLTKPRTAAAVMVICDVLVLAAAVILDALRARVPATFSFDPSNVEVDVSHPYDLFGIVTAVFLVIAAVMTGFMIAGAVAGSKSKMPMRITGAAVLLIVSAAVVIFSYFFVCGLPIKNTICFVFENNGMNIAVQETEYAFGAGTMDIYRMDETSHVHEDGSAHSEFEVSHITGVEITEFSSDDTRYTLDWVLEHDLRVRFFDGDIHRTLQFTLE